MYYTELGFTSYQQYLESGHWEKIKKIRIGKKCERRFCGNSARVCHHLHYRNLGKEEHGRDYVDICYSCNDLAHFYDDRSRVPVTENGYLLIKRWKEINSLWYLFANLKPSDIFDWIGKSYSIENRRHNVFR